jgi:WhiB family redox-sensing transcriptional regulator
VYPGPDRPVVATERTLPAEPVQKHLVELGRAGVSLMMVSERTGLSRNAIKVIRLGQQRRVRVSTRDRIMAVTADAAGPVALVDARPTQQLVDELVATGLSRSAIGRMAGIRAPGVGLSLGDRWVYKRTADAIGKVADEVLRPRKRSTQVSRIGRLVASLDQEWRAEAACRSTPKAVFFPEHAGVVPARAAALCAGCPVADPCLEFALVSRSIGVWAGTSEADRRRMRRRRRAA